LKLGFDEFNLDGDLNYFTKLEIGIKYFGVGWKRAVFWTAEKTMLEGGIRFAVYYHS
jgi:hypothetical protein